MFKPTDEQIEITSATKRGESFKVYAGAGAGKTATIRLSAQEVERSVYVVFNRAAKDEAKLVFPPSCYISTLHGLAYRDIGKEYDGRITGSIWQLRRELLARAPEMRGVADDVLATFATFLNSADERVLAEHAPSKARDAMRCAHEAQRVFDWASDTDDAFPITHDVYLKVWQLHNGQIDAPTIFADEWQDNTPVAMAIMQQQSIARQQIFVGDPYQQIYAWRGAVNSLQNLDLPLHTLTSSWRFGQDVADVANTILDARKAPFAIRGMAASTVHVGEDSEASGVIARTNGGLVASAVRAVTDGKTLHVLGGVEQLTTMLEGAYAVKVGQKTRHPVFSTFSSWAELKEAVEESPAAAEFKAVVKIVDAYGGEMPKVCTMLKTAHVAKSSDADVTVGTAHSYKGQQTRFLQVEDDSQPFSAYHAKSRRYVLDEESANIAYVMVTRAMERLTLSPGFAATLDSSLKNTEQYWLQRGKPLKSRPREALAVVFSRCAEIENAERAKTEQASNGRANGLQAMIVTTDEARSFLGRYAGTSSVNTRGGASDLAFVQSNGKLYAFREVEAFSGLEPGAHVAVLIQRIPTPRVVVYAEHRGVALVGEAEARSS